MTTWDSPNEDNSETDHCQELLDPALWVCSPHYQILHTGIHDERAAHPDTPAKSIRIHTAPNNKEMEVNEALSSYQFVNPTCHNKGLDSLL